MWRGFFVSLGPFYTMIKLSMHGVEKTMIIVVGNSVHSGCKT
jgi:hypothetical protein